MGRALTTARPIPLKCKNEYLVHALGKETAVQALVGSIVWAFCRLEKPRSQEMSAHGYALYSVCPQLSFPCMKLVSRYTVLIFTDINMYTWTIDGMVSLDISRQISGWIQ